MLRKILNLFLIVLVFIYIVFEEVIWEKTAKPLIELFNKLNLLLNLEEKIKNLNSYVVLIFFLLIFVFVEVLGIYAGILFLQAKIITAIFIYLLKIPVAVFILWFFDITKDKLLKFRWFNFLYTHLILAIEKLKNSKTYILIKEKTLYIKEFLKEKLTFSKGELRAKIATVYRKIKEKFAFKK